MTEAFLYGATQAGLWAAVQLATPLLAVALMAGLTIGLMQALTSVQEATLTFVPKLGAMLAVFWLSMGFMTTTLADFFREVVLPAAMGG